MPADKIVFKVGAEGGSLAILRYCDQNGAPRYIVQKDGSTLLDMLNDDDREGLSSTVTTGGISEFDQALAISNPSQWVRLVPVFVHPSYLERVLQEVERHGGPAQRSRWANLLTVGSDADMPANSILSGTKDIINRCFLGSSHGTKSYRHISEARRLRGSPVNFDAETMLRRLLDQIRINLECRNTESTSQSNWRDDPLRKISPNNKSTEVRLERAIAALDRKPRDWWNQMPIASGIVRSQADRRRAIDLIHDCSDGDNEFDFIELKIDSDNPLFALMEIVLYGLVYLALRTQPDALSQASRDARVFKAEKINLRVLAPGDYYKPYSLDWLHDELNAALATITREQFAGRLSMTVSSHWPDALEVWNEKILTDQQTLLSVLDIGNWHKAYCTRRGQQGHGPGCQ